MGVYVDAAIHQWKDKKWCHLIGDDFDELHDFAQKIGLKREWFQNKNPFSLPHYDITEAKRAQAIRMGAIEINREELVNRIQAHRERLKNIPD